MNDILESLGMPNLSARGAYQVLTRRKPIEDSNESKLAKVLSALDLTALGIGSTLGVGVYVLAGVVAKNHAGPAVVISFLIAAIASIFAGLCYAEFGARVPKAGSAYIYSYVTIGEFIAFIIGWNLILEYSIGTASVVKGVSTYLDELCNKAVSRFLTELMPMKVQGLSGYPDIFAFSVTLIFSWAIALGAKESSRLNNVFTFLNLSVVLFVIIAGLFKVKSSNWAIPKESVPEGYGNGGFAPYGFAGIITGAARCFYGFIGFDCIATAGEEAKNPKKSIPFAVIVSLGMIFLAYFGVSTVLTMMLPYYEQNEKAPLSYVFEMYGWTVATYVVKIGAIFGLSCSLMGAMFPLPRIVFAMASDGLLFKFMGEISKKYKTPYNSTLLTGFLTGLLATVFDLDQLIDMMSLGTLLAYSMVASCVLILRYDCDDRRELRNLGNGRTLMDNNDEKCAFWRKLFNTRRSLVATQQSARIVTIATTCFGFWSFAFSEILSALNINVNGISPISIVVLTFSVAPLLLLLYIISRQPTSEAQLAFKVPFVPWLPGISILINVYLMITLDISTWIRFCIWIAIGLIIYFTYSIRHSRLRQHDIHLTTIGPDNELTSDIVANSRSSTVEPLICMQNMSSRGSATEVY